ncbi:hypothetical protein STEG23_016712, partial [Scotinomys teguina]
MKRMDREDGSVRVSCDFSYSSVIRLDTGLAYHLQKSSCGECGYPAKRKRKCNWSAKAKRVENDAKCPISKVKKPKQA